MDEFEIIIDTEEISDYLFEKLVERGLVPSGDELYVLADIVFDYLNEKFLIEEIDTDSLKDEDDEENDI